MPVGPLENLEPINDKPELIEFVQKASRSYVAACMYPEGCYPEPISCEYKATGRVSGCEVNKC